jgi:hypothetical protein
VALGVLAACWAIIAGIDAWKREFIGKRRIELAEQLLAKFFEVKDAVAYIRNPFSNSEEGKSRQRSGSELADEAELLDRGYVVVERYTKKESVFAEFNALKYRCMAGFPSHEAESIFTDTFSTVNSIFSSARQLATHYWKRQGRVVMSPKEFQRHLDEMHRHEASSGIWMTGRMKSDDNCRASRRGWNDSRGHASKIEGALSSHDTADSVAPQTQLI